MALIKTAPSAQGVSGNQTSSQLQQAQQAPSSGSLGSTAAGSLAKPQKMDAQQAEIARLKQQLSHEQFNGWGIMEARNYIDKQLHVNAAVIGQGLASPYFDDLVKVLVNKLVLFQQQGSAVMSPHAYVRFYAASQATNLVPTVTSTVTSSGSTWSAWCVASGNSATTHWIDSPWYGADPQPIGYAPAPKTDDDGSIYYEIPAGRPGTYRLPNGAMINVKADGSFALVTDDAKVRYKACAIRNFNRYVNASDILEEFAKFCANEVGIGRREIGDLPLRLFIGFLILEAAKADEEPIPADIKLLPDLRKAAKPRCRCGRFLSPKRHRAGLSFCGVRCFERAEALAA